MTEQEPVICQNCHTEMKAGGKTRSKVMEWTEYNCPNGCSPWSEGKPLPGHEPKPVVPKVALETKPAPPAKKRTRKKAKKKATVPKTKAETESFADDLGDDT